MTTISSNESPFTDDKIARVEVLRKELKVFNDLMNAGHADRLSPMMTICLNPHTLDPKEVGQLEADRIREWFGRTDAKEGIKQAIFRNDHEINGKADNWSCGFLGSRWMDRSIAGRRCRFAFYTPTSNPKLFKSGPAGKKYFIMIDPTS